MVHREHTTEYHTESTMNELDGSTVPQQRSQAPSHAGEDAGAHKPKQMNILDFSSVEKVRANLQRLEQGIASDIKTSDETSIHFVVDGKNVGVRSISTDHYGSVVHLKRTIREDGYGSSQLCSLHSPESDCKDGGEALAALYSAKRHEFPLLHTLLKSRAGNATQDMQFKSVSNCERTRLSIRALENLTGIMRRFVPAYQPVDGSMGDLNELRMERMAALHRHSDSARRRDVAQLNEIFTRNGDRYFSAKNSPPITPTHTPFNHDANNSGSTTGPSGSANSSTSASSSGSGSSGSSGSSSSSSIGSGSGGDRQKGKSKAPSCAGVDVNDEADRACIGFWSQTPKLRERGLPGKCRGLSIVQVKITEPEIPPVLSVKPETSDDLTNAQTLAMHMTDAEKERAVQQGHLQEVSDELCVGFWKQTRLMRMEGLPGECIGVSIVEVEKEKDYYSTNYCPVIGVSVLRMDAPADAQRPVVSLDKESLNSTPQPLHERLQSLAQRAASLGMLMGESATEFVKEKCTKEAAKNVLEAEYELLKNTAENVRTLKVVTIAQEYVPGNCRAVIEYIKKWWRGGEGEEN